MKKLLIYVFALLICACSNSDDPNEVTQDPIIGIWKPVREVVVFNDGHEESEAFTVCELKNRITFQGDGRFFMTDYPDSNDPNCEELVGNLYLSGEWVQLSKNQYRIELICYIPNCDQTIVETPDLISFPMNNIMRVHENDDDPGNGINYYFDEFERIE